MSSSAEDWLARSMVHTITVIPGTTSADGEALPDMFGEVNQGDSPNKNVHCLINTTKRRAFNEQTRESVRYHTVVFGLDSKVDIDWSVKDGYNQHGQLLLKSGKITSADPIQHFSEGIIGYNCTIEEN